MTLGMVDARARLRGLYLELTAEYEDTTAEVAAVAHATDGAGDDDIDAGAKVAQREQQLSVLASIRTRRDQVAHALSRLDQGTYGTCELCAGAIAEERLEAFPMATTCVACPTP
jgi:RNA polymerase-binding transcription factor